MEKITSKVASNSKIQWFLHALTFLCHLPFLYSDAQSQHDPGDLGRQWEARAGRGTGRRGVSQKPGGWKPTLQRASKGLPATKIPLSLSYCPGHGPGGRWRLVCHGGAFQSAHPICAAYKGQEEGLWVGHQVSRVHKSNFYIQGSGTHRRKGIRSPALRNI